MSGSRHAKEVSCLALTFFYDYVEGHGHSRRELQEGLPYSPEYLDTRTNWIDYATFLEVERRMARLFPNPNLFYEIGLTFGATKGFGFLRPIFRSIVSPIQLYSQLPRLVGRFLFPFVTIRFNRLKTNHLRARYTFAEGFPPSDAFYEVVRGLLASVPLMTGSERAAVTYEHCSPLEAIFDIRLSNDWGGALGVARNVQRRLVATSRLLWSNAGVAISELEETNRLLQEKVDAVTEAKEQLDRKVWQLSILNAVASAAASELELPRLLDKVTSLISRELDDAPTVMLLAEGEPVQLVVASSVAVDSRALQGLRAASLKEALSELPFTIIDVQGTPFFAIRMMRGDALLAVLVVALKQAEDEHDRSFLDALAGHLGVAIANAQAYQTITDLRDNLEVRVRERTAELEEARGQLEDTVERLRRSDRARNEFFTNVSHELRTPLTLILAPLDALESSLRDAPESARSHLRSIRDNAQSLLRLINEILDFAKLDAERMPLSPAETDLVQLVDDVVVTLRPLAERKQVALTWERPTSDVTAWVDPKLTRRVLMNLVGNAVKYVEPGQSVRVAVGEQGDDALLDVGDSGPGIPREYQAKIFERFQRVPDATGRIIEGSGIGLAMVKEIVQLHRGSIELESEPGHGANFRVQLPRMALATTPASVAEAPIPDDFSAFVETLSAPVQTAPHPRAKEGNSSRGRLLIVEDNAEMRAFFERLFGDEYRLTIAQDGEEGLTKAEAELPDAIVSDVMMPKLDGYELCRKLKTNTATRNIPVILVSARHGTEAALEGFNAGADDFVVKPFSAPELLARVAAQMRIRALSLAVMRMEKQTTLGLMAAGIAHEVLNPVNAIVNAVPPLQRSLDLLQRGRGEEARTCDVLLGSVERSGRRIQNVVQAILAFSRQDHGELRLRDLHLSEGIEATLAILQFRIHDGILVHREYSWDGSIDCYPELLNQLLMNLLVNALDALGPKGGNIWICLDRMGDSVRLRIRDDGPGVPIALRERVFDPFFTTKPVGAGTGLGLPLAREIVALHNGSIELGDGPDGGAEFTVLLPQERVRPVVTLNQQQVYA